MSPAKKYDYPVRLSQRWPKSLLESVESAAKNRGWNATQWLQEAARIILKREMNRAMRLDPKLDPKSENMGKIK